MRNILTQIQSGQYAFAPDNMSHKAIMEFQAIAKRIEEARNRGYIRDAKVLPSQSGDAYGVAIHVAVLGGLTYEGEQRLLGDHDDRAF
jgi:hypothetical protein